MCIFQACSLSSQPFLLCAPSLVSSTGTRAPCHSPLHIGKCEKQMCVTLGPQREIARMSEPLHPTSSTLPGWLTSVFGKQTPTSCRSYLLYRWISSSHSSANFCELLHSKYFSLCNSAGPCLHLILPEPSKS
jgi:hypothetical protein